MKRVESVVGGPSMAGRRKVDRVALLEKVAELGSITAAAKVLVVNHLD